MGNIPEEVLLALAVKNSGGGSGTSDYDQLSNKPQIGGVTLSGNKSASDLSLASLDSNGKVPASQLPSYVDDVINGYLHDGKFYEDDQYTTEISGEDGKIYVDLATNKTYRWSGLAFVEISESLALGETASTAYAGNKGKANADAITAILDGQSIDSFADVETALSSKANSSTVNAILDGQSIDSFGDVETALNGKQASLSAGDYIDIDGNEISVNRVIPNEEVSYEIVTKSTSSDPYTNAQTVKKFVNGTEVSSADYTRYSVEQEYAEHKVVFDDVLWLGYGAAGTQGGWSYGLLVASDDHSAGYLYEWGWNSEVDVTEDFSIVDHSGEKLIIKSELDAAIAGKQNTLTAGDYIQFNGNEISVNRSIAVNAVRRYVFRGSESTRYIDTYLDDELVDTVSMYFTESARNFNDEISVVYDGTSKWLITNLKASTTKPQGYVEQRGFYDSSEYTQSFEIELHAGDKLVIKDELDAAIANKQDKLTFDSVPTDGSTNPVESNGIYDALASKADASALASKADITDLAPAFSTSTAYTVGQYVSYDGNIYKCTSAHSAGAWVAGDFTLVAVASELETKQPKTDNSLTTTSKDTTGAINEVNSNLTSLETDVEELQAYTGYGSSEIIGVEVDYVNKSFRRLGAAVGKNGGSDFDNFPMFGGRRRCNVADDGTISKYYGDTGYAEDGTNGQVMVYQPKFYYKMVPLKLEKQSTGKGYHIRKAAYYVTATPLKGFKVHPAFVDASGNELEYILIGASKGCIYDVSESAYITDDSQVMDNTADKFSSIFGVKPASGLTQDLTRPKIEQMCQNRGANWHELNVQMVAMTELLMLIEYGKFDMQRAVGKGVVDITDNSSYNCAATSGSTSALGNVSGRATSTTIVTNTSTTYTDDGKTSITYRGEEDPYGDMWEFIMGMNVWGNGSMNGGEPYICSDYNYAESKNDGNYKGAGFTIANSDGYVNAWGYGSEDFDWLFMASEVGGSDALPVGDYLWKTANLNGYRIALMGARWNDSWRAGAFGWAVYGAVGDRYRGIGGRLAYLPS